MNKKIGIIHYNAPGKTLEEFLEYASETGFRYVELMISDVWKPGVDDLESEAARVRKTVESFGIQVSAIGAGNDFVVLDEEIVKAQVARMKKIAQIAVALGTNVIRTEGGSPKDSVPQEKWEVAIADCLKRCQGFVEDMGVYLALDNHGWVTNDGDLQVRIFKSVGSPNIGANLDTMNYRWFGHDIETVNRYYEIVAPYVFHVHLKDGTGSRGSYVGAPLGEGEIDLKHAIKCLKDVGYDGVWCAEYEGREGSDVGYARYYRWMVENL